MSLSRVAVCSSIVLAATVAGCGSDRSAVDGPATETTPAPRTSTTTTTDQPAGLDSPSLVGDPGSKRCGRHAVTGRVPQGTVLEKGSAVRQASGPVDVSVRVAKAAVVSAVHDPYRAGNPRLRATTGNRFVAVVYAVRNRGKRSILPRYSVNKPFVLRAGGTYWRSTEWSRPCRTASAALSTDQRLHFVNRPVKPGEVARSVALYVVPVTQSLVFASSVTGAAVRVGAPGRLR